MPIRTRLKYRLENKPLFHFFVLYGYHYTKQHYIAWDPNGYYTQPGSFYRGNILRALRSDQWTHTYFKITGP